MDDFKKAVIEMHPLYSDKAQVIYEKYKDTPKDGLKNLYKCITLVASGEGGNAYHCSHQASLLGGFVNGLMFCHVKADTASKHFKEFIGHLRNQYVDGQPQYDDAKFDSEITTFVSRYIKDGEYIPPEDKKPVKRLESDLRALRRLKRMAVSAISTGSPYKNLDNMVPSAFLSKMFNDEVLQYTLQRGGKSKMGYAAMAYNADEHRYLCNFKDKKKVEAKLLVDPDYIAPDSTLPSTAFDKRKKGYNRLGSYKALDKMLFMSRSVYISHTDDKGDGKLTNYAKEAYLILECDLLSVQDRERHIAFNMRIFSKHAPLVAVVDTGGKSIHFHYAIHNADPEVVDEFKKIAVRYCADFSIIKNKVALVRLPNAKRQVDGRREQKLLYFDESNTRPLETEEKWDLIGLEQTLSDLAKTDIYHLDGKFYKCIGDDDGKDLDDDGEIINNNDSVRRKWIGLSREAMTNQLAKMGIRRATLEGEDVSPAMSLIADIENYRSIDKSVPQVGGYNEGLFMDDKDVSYLIQNNTKYPNILKGKQINEFVGINKYLDNIFEEREKSVLLGWLSGSLRALYNKGNDTANLGFQAQMLHIIGHHGNGKSLFRMGVMDKLFGKIAEADALFTDSSFNGSQSEANMLYLDDTKVLLTTAENRRLQGETIKKSTVGGGGAISYKFQDSFSLPKFTVLTRFMNKQNMDTLPDMSDTSVASKLILLDTKTYPNDAREMPTEVAENYLKKVFPEEIDAFYTYLLQEHVIDKDIVGSRFPTISYVSPSIDEEVSASSPDQYIMDILDCSEPLLYSNVTIQGEKYYHGSALDIYREIQKRLSHSDEKIFSKMIRSEQVFKRVLNDVCKIAPHVVKYSNDKDAPLEPKKYKSSLYYRVMNAADNSEEI